MCIVQPEIDKTALLRMLFQEVQRLINHPTCTIMPRNLLRFEVLLIAPRKCFRTECSGWFGTFVRAPGLIVTVCFELWGISDVTTSAQVPFADVCCCITSGLEQAR